jgi:hypothetical protein
MKKARCLTAVLLTVFTLGCAGLTPTQQRALSGGAIGAAGGAAIGAIAGGNAWIGAAVGGPVGVIAGTLIGVSQQHK